MPEALQSYRPYWVHLGMEILTRIGQNLRRDRAIHREQDSKNQTADRGVGRHTPRRSIATVQRLRQPDVPVQSHAAGQARSLLSNQLHLEGQEQIAVCPRRRCRGGQPPVGELSSTARSGRRMGDIGRRVVAAPNAPASSLGEESGAKTIDSQEKAKLMPQKTKPILTFSPIIARAPEFRDRN